MKSSTDTATPTRRESRRENCCRLAVTGIVPGQCYLPDRPERQVIF